MILLYHIIDNCSSYFIAIYHNTRQIRKLFMIAQNVVNPEKKSKIQGFTFHLFYPDLNTSILFDKDFTSPIIWGSKNVVMTTLKKIGDLLGTDTSTKVRIYSYIMTQEGYRRIDTYNGPIETIGKYIRRY